MIMSIITQGSGLEFKKEELLQKNLFNHHELFGLLILYRK